MPTSDPNIVYFTANPSTIKLGEKSTLSWEVHDCTSVEIDEGIGKVSPLRTTTYTLLAKNIYYDEQTGVLVGGSATKTSTITVEN